MVTKVKIVQLLKTNDKAVARALVVLNERQTADEQQKEMTRYQNGRGFRPCHARMGTSMAQFYLQRNYLTAKQIAYWRMPQKDGKMRIEIYAGQLLEVAEAKAKTKAAQQTVRILSQLPGDAGNLMEEYAALEKMIDDCNPIEADRIFDRMIQIREQLEEISRCQQKMAMMA